MSTAGVVQLILWGGGAAFVAAWFFRSWRKRERARRTDTPEEAYQRAVSQIKSGQRNRRAAGGIWAAGGGTVLGPDGGGGGGDCGGSGCGGGGGS